MTEEEKLEMEEHLLKREKGFVDKIGYTGIVTLLTLATGIITSFSVGQYRINQQEAVITELKSAKETDGKTLSAMAEQIKSLNGSINELKDQNKETYRLLLDISQRP